jgi:prevent-host-death family protein
MSPSLNSRPGELLRSARSEGPQLITRQGKEGVVMISEEQYDQLVDRFHQPKNLVQFFRESPLVGVELDLEGKKMKGVRPIYERIFARYQLDLRGRPSSPRPQR